MACRREIKKLQHSTKLLLNPKSFESVVIDITNEQNEILFTFEKDALLALQEAAEAHLIKLLSASNECAMSAGRITIQRKDLILAKRLDDKSC